MPDHTPLQPRIHGWSDAFAALPLESPDAGALQRLQRAAARRRAPRWPAWASMAAVLALAAVLPWQSLRPAPGKETRPVPAAAKPAGAAATGDATVAITQPRRAASPQPRGVSHQAETAAALPTAQRAASTIAGLRRPDHADRVRLRARAAVPAVADAQAGASPPARLTSSSAPGQPSAGGERSIDAQLEPLYAESARLEALLALARDDRVATGASAALTSAYEAQVASIDAALREPALPGGARSTLWQQRVDALRQFAGFESTQRALAASGERYDAMLVSID